MIRGRNKISIYHAWINRQTQAQLDPPFWKEHDIQVSMGHTLDRGSYFNCKFVMDVNQCMPEWLIFFIDTYNFDVILLYLLITTSTICNDRDDHIWGETTKYSRVRYNKVQYDMRLHIALQCLRQNIDHNLKAPWRASHGVSFVWMWEKTDRVITTAHCYSYRLYHRTSVAK